MQSTIRLIGAAIITLTLCAQTPAVDVASVKANHGTGQARYPYLRNGTLTAENASLKTLFAVAYGLTELCITGPSWLDSEHFDITAKAKDGVPDTEAGPLLQSLLKERFEAVVHREMRETSAYDLVIDKDGLKMHVLDATHVPLTPQNRGGSAIVGAGTMAQLAQMLTRAAGRPVLNKIDVEGRYVYVLTYTSLNSQALENAPPGPPDLFTAVREQLGVRLEPKKEPVEFLVIDHVERSPAEN